MNATQMSPGTAGPSPDGGSAAAGGPGSPGGEDDDVTAAIAAGDYRGAVALCARRHGPALGRLCMAMVGSQSEAEDLAQDTLIAAHDSFPTYEGKGSLRSWLFSIARRRCARHLEKMSRRDSRLRLVYDADRDASTEEMAQLRQQATRARAALAEIRPSEREAVLLRFESELSFREVGLACGIEEAAARKRVSRAMAKLRDALSDEE